MKQLVMIVDDQPDIRDALGEFLREVGYATAFAANGREALDLLMEAPQLPDIILLDLMMPHMDGWAFREAQVMNPKVAGIPVVVLTAFEAPQTRGISATAILYKPFDPSELVSTIERTTGRKSEAGA